MNELNWQIDSFVQENGMVFSQGWIFNKTKTISRLSLNLVEDTKDCIFADYGKKREDVGAFYPGFSNSICSGFIVYGTFSTKVNNSELELVCYYSDGEVESVIIPNVVVISDNVNKNRIKKIVIFKQFLVLMKRAIALLKAGNFSLLFEKIKRFKNTIPTKQLENAAEINELLDIDEKRNMIFFLDHDYGGGANLYRNRIIEEKIASGWGVLVLVYNISTLSYKLIVRGRRGVFSYRISGYDFIFSLLNYIKINEIIYNTGVSFCNPETIPGFLVSLKLKSGAKLITLAHDFFPVCPSHFLIDDNGIYCDIPDPSICISCLRHNSYGFTKLFESGDINEWRDKWGGLIIASDRLRFFSGNTLKLYKKVYPQLDNKKTSIVPHSVDYLPKRMLITQKEHLRIGVIGQIGYHKGAKVVRELSQKIHDEQYPVKIIVIGTIEDSCPSDVVTQTGPYERSQLPALIQKCGVNVILFPSIWPETFSYVVQEMIELAYPVACFDLGAPADRIRNYQSGLILSSMSPASILKELIDFHRQLYPIQ